MDMARSESAGLALTHQTAAVSSARLWTVRSGCLASYCCLPLSDSRPSSSEHGETPPLRDDYPSEDIANTMLLSRPRKLVRDPLIDDVWHSSWLALYGARASRAEAACLAAHRSRG